jgi:hypothetical protein
MLNNQKPKIQNPKSKIQNPKPKTPKIPMPIYVFITYFLKLLIVLSGLALVGQAILYRSTAKPYARLFWAVLLSVLLFATVVAGIYTGGATVLGGFVLWGVLWYGFRRTRASDVEARPKGFLLTNVWVMLLSILVVFSWSFFAFVKGGDFPFALPPGTALAPNDVHIYALRSNYLALTGQENYFGNYNIFDPHFHGARPYHYLELWLNSGLTQWTGGKGILNLRLVTGPLFQILSLLGILALWEYFGKVRWYHVLLSLAGLWVAGFYLFYAPFGFPSFSLPIMTYRFKMVVYYPFLLGAALCFLEKQTIRGLLCLLGLCLSTIVAVPAVLGGAGVWLLWTAFGRKNWLLAGSGLLTVVLILGYVALFYGLQGSGAAGSTFEIQSGELSVDRIADRFPTIAKTFGYGLLHLLVLYAPYVLLGLAFRQKLRSWSRQIAGFLVLAIGLLFGGAGAHALLYDFAQASQLFYNIAIPLANVLAIVMLLYLAKHSTRQQRFLLGIFTFVIVLNQLYLTGKVPFQEQLQTNYSESYLTTIDNLVQDDELSRLGGALRAPADYQSDYAKMTAGYTLGYYLLYMDNEIATISLSDLDIPINPKNERNNRKDIASGAFYQFVQRQKQEGNFVSKAQSQLDFIKMHDIGFLILTEKAELPSLLQKRVKQMLTDSISGERFILLDL